MSEESSTRRNNALDFLDELDERHDFLLDELEQLNVRIDSVLSEYTKSRQTASHATAIVAESATEQANPIDSPLNDSNGQVEAADFD